MTKGARLKLRAEMRAAYGEQCYWCGTTKGYLNIEHLIPRSKGGRSNVHNCRFGCVPCNSRKGNMYPKEFMRLKLKEFHKLLNAPAFRDYKEMAK